MAYNKFITSSGKVFLDLTNDTITPEDLREGVIAHDRSGNTIVGAMADSAIPIEVSTEAEMTALLENGEVGGVYKYTGTTRTYENNSLHILKNTIGFETSDGYYISSTDGTVFVTNDGLEFDELTDIVSSKFFEEGCANISLPRATQIRNYAFCEDRVLRSVDMPFVASIGDYAFRNCSKLDIESMSPRLLRIGKYAFSGCTSISLTELPSSLQSIGFYGFENCKNLALTSLPDGCEY